MKPRIRLQAKNEGLSNEYGGDIHRFNPARTRPSPVTGCLLYAKPAVPQNQLISSSGVRRERRDYPR
jgi:hypothetical protein